MKTVNGIVLFYRSWLSNFHEAGFWWPSVDSPMIYFKTSEQGFMWYKAMFFKDYQTAEKIYKATTPREAKDLGRLVKNYDDSAWANVRYNVMLDMNYQKYTQNPDLARRLASFPEGTKFAEASPIDRIWGIGISEDDPDAKTPEKWKGQNLLGKVLTEVFQRITS